MCNTQDMAASSKQLPFDMQTTFSVQRLDIAAVVERKFLTGLMVKQIFDSFLAGLAPAMTHCRMSDWFRSIQKCNDYPSATTHRMPVRHNALHTTRGNAVIQRLGEIGDYNIDQLSSKLSSKQMYM